MTTNETEFSDFAAARWPRLVRAAILLGCPRHEAEDLTQTALVKCYVAWKRVSAAENPDAYAYRVLVNAFNASRRRRWSGEVPTQDLPETDVRDQSSTVDMRDAVTRALAGLTSDQRNVLVLRYYAGLTEEQTASALRVRPGTVKSRASRAIERLSLDPNLLDIHQGRC